MFYPKTHLMVAVALVVALTAIGSLPSEEASASREQVKLEIPAIEDSADLEELEAHFVEEDDTLAIEPMVSPGIIVIEESVRSGDTLSSIFYRAGLNDRDVYNVTSSSDAGKNLARLYPGHKFIFTVDERKTLLRLNHVIDELNSQSFTASETGFIHDELVRKPDIRVTTSHSVIESSLYNAGKDANLSEQTIMELAGIFGWDIDFALDIRKGDSFKILFEEKFLDGEKIGVGDILAAEFSNQNATFKAVRYIDDSGRAQYYTPTGKAMRKAFLRAPLDFRRISSNFNPRRLHPISKTVRPHRGTDYAANRGTPVWASGDGKVIASGYTKANGNYVVIQHGNEIQTKYLHLHKRSVKRGDRVRQKQIIGTVGSTGYSTAPHLHYEFLLNGVHRNPRTIVNKLPKAESINKEDLPRFFEQTRGILAQLGQTTQMAATESDTTAL